MQVVARISLGEVEYVADTKGGFVTFGHKGRTGGACHVHGECTKESRFHNCRVRTQTAF